MRRSPQDTAQREMAAAKKLLGPGFLEDRIIQAPINGLVPYANNARTHNDKQLAAIGRSIAAVGFINPVLATRDGVIIAGQGRVEAAKLLGMT